MLLLRIPIRLKIQNKNSNATTTVYIFAFACNAKNFAIVFIFALTVSGKSFTIVFLTQKTLQKPCFLLFLFLYSFLDGLTKVGIFVVSCYSCKHVWLISNLSKWHTTMPMFTKHGSVMTYFEGLLPIKSHVPLITWLSEFTWQIKIIISSLMKCVVRVVTYSTQLPLKTLVDSSITWSCEVTW